MIKPRCLVAVAALVGLTTAVFALTPVGRTVKKVPMWKMMELRGMVDAGANIPNLVVDLVYRRADNFTGSVIYDPDFNRAYLHPEAAAALAKAAAELRRLRPDLYLKITDATRPMSAQRKMYKVVQGTSKARYVSNPANGGGLHNYGLAVDITLSDKNGNELPMGTPVDHLGVEANIDKEEQLVRQGKLTRVEKNNRELLRRVMVAGGFQPLKSEWWHFNLTSRENAKRHYKPIDF